MSYEYNHSIQFDLDRLSYYENVVELEEKKNEIYEVYSKAQAFDDIVSWVEHQESYDLTDSMVMQDIYYVIRRFFNEMEDN